MSDIAASIRERLAELDDERARLGLALLALESLSNEELDDSLSTHPGRRRRRSTKRRAVSLEWAVHAIAGSPDATMDLIKRVGGDRNQLLALLKGG